MRGADWYPFTPRMYSITLTFAYLVKELLVTVDCRVASALLAAAVLIGCGSGASLSSGPTPPTGPAPGNGEQVVGVSGTRMTLNGSPWLSRGVVLQGFVRPLSALQSDPTEAARLNARVNYGQAELDAIRSFHADTIRFQIGQPALDPNSPLYDPAYLTDVENAIKTARQAGFVVMIMMQDEAISGETTPHPLPIAETQNDWDQFAAAFGSDRGVVFELYNEPNLLASAANWELWLNGGSVQSQGQTQTAIGMQELVNHLRARGAQNVFVLDGLGVMGPDGTTRELTETLQGVPAVTDPLNRLVYAVHPYQHGFTDESQWDAEFGIPSQTLPVWADEWSAPEGLKLGLGTLTDYQVAVDLLNYFNAHSISLCTGAFDMTQFVVQTVPGWTLTNYDSSSSMKGSGTLVSNDFAADYSRTLTKADGL